VALSVDPPEESARVVDKLGLEYPIVSDPGADTISAYGVLHAEGGLGGVDIARPAIFVIDPAGGVRWRSLTENWRVRVRPDEILAAVRSID
jgi:peroxiredoxin